MSRALLVLALTSLAAFVSLSVAVERDALGALDRDLADWVAAELPRWAEWLARPFSWLGGWIGLTALGTAAVIALARARAWLDLGFLVAALLGSQLAVAVLKAGFDRPRPEVGSAVPLPDTAGFPSGHATAGAAALGALAVLAAERLPSGRARTWLGVATVILCIGVGLSRIALGVHFLTDVLAGWLLGLAWLAACLLARDALRSRGARGRPGAQLPSARGRDDADPGPAPGGDRGPARLGP
ncbi:MAG TPA: phosphatase PAP2 family protein [Gaiellaceae bacterium]|nr:phosphatase PAP2 family protein [Gaiellaceae bacterium]